MGDLHRIKIEVLEIKELNMKIIASLMLESTSEGREGSEFLVGFLEDDESKSNYSFYPIYKYGIKIIEEALKIYNDLKEKIEKKEWVFSELTQELMLK